MRTAFLVFGAILQILIASACWAAENTLPHEIGRCIETTITAITDRFGNDVRSPSGETYGTVVKFSNGGSQVSYERETVIVRSKIGDPVKMCLASTPKNCPPGDDRGRIYNTLNLRTGEAWTLSDSQHMCGGA